MRVVNDRPEPRCWDHGCNGRVFSTFSNLLRHQRERAGKSKISTCAKCGGQFTRTTALRGMLSPTINLCPRIEFFSAHQTNDKCKPGAGPIRAKRSVYVPKKRHQSPMDDFRRKPRPSYRIHRRAATLNDISAVIGREPIDWGQQQARSTDASDRNFEEQWVHINKLPPGPWSNNATRESPDPLGVAHVEREGSNPPFNMDDYHDPTLYEAQTEDAKIHESHCVSTVPNPFPSYDVTSNLKAFETTASPALPMISTFPSYKGQPVTSPTPSEVHKVEEVPPTHLLLTFPSYKGRPVDSHTPIEIRDSDDEMSPRIKQESED